MTKHLLLATLIGTGVAAADELTKCNVVWDSPSADARGSMPIGNGDVGINAGRRFGLAAVGRQLQETQPSRAKSAAAKS